MKQKNDEVTRDLLGGAIRQRGRPATGKAKSGAQRQAERRERLRMDGKDQLSVVLPADVIAFLDEFVRFKGLSKDQVIERLLRSQLMRKR